MRKQKRVRPTVAMMAEQKAQLEQSEERLRLLASAYNALSDRYLASMHAVDGLRALVINQRGLFSATFRCVPEGVVKDTIQVALLSDTKLLMEPRKVQPDTLGQVTGLSSDDLYRLIRAK